MENVIIIGTGCAGYTAAVAVPLAEAMSGGNLPLDVAVRLIEPEAAERAVSRGAAPPPERAPGAP